MNYGDKIKALRERIGITQVELARIIGLGNKTYSHYENEDLIIPLKYLIKIADYFNVSLDYLFNFTDKRDYKNTKIGVNKIRVGQRLKEFRKEYKLTQVGLALELNTVHPVITNYEKGKNLIATSFLYIICKNYKVSADYILGRIDYKPVIKLKVNV